MCTPFGMDLLSCVRTGLAWDNFDRFVETSSGKDTLHDTVGIAYQIMQPSNSSDVNIDFESHTEATNIETKGKNLVIKKGKDVLLNQQV